MDGTWLMAGNARNYLAMAGFVESLTVGDGQLSARPALAATA
jgi:hypothetical protein